jgi:hypothetical protein
VAAGGGGMFVRQYLLYGKGWQRAGIVLALVGGGVTLLVLDNLIGLLPVLLGVALGLRMWGPARLRAAQFQRGHRPEPPDPVEDR